MNMLIPKTKAQNDCLNNSFLMVICNGDLLFPQEVSRNSAFLRYLHCNNSQKIFSKNLGGLVMPYNNIMRKISLIREILNPSKFADSSTDTKKSSLHCITLT